MIHPQFESHLETIALEFLENKIKYQEIISIHHTDADGISSGLIISTMVSRLKIPLRQFSFDLDISWNLFLDNLKQKLDKSCAIILSDLCPSASELNDFIKEKPNIDIYILDHHFFRNDEKISLPENIYNCNPTQFGLNGLKEIVGATLNYLFVKEVDPKNENLAWIATIGMGGDVLDHINNYNSYNLQVINEAIDSGQVDIHNGICIYGCMYEKLYIALANSILPYLKIFEGNPQIAKFKLKEWGIDPNTKIDGLTVDQIKILDEKIQHPNLQGKYITLPKKKGLLHFVFEHAHLISFFGHNKIQEAFSLINARSATQDQKEEYKKKNRGIVENLTTFIKMDKILTESSIIVDLTNKIPVEMWSNTGSFASINHIYDPTKILFIGGISEGVYKFSVRCTTNFIEKHHNNGVNVVIGKLISLLGEGQGGGHGLAGGIRFDPSKLEELVSFVDKIVSEL